MKILEINKFNYAKGGADRHFLDLVNLLKSDGNEVAVFSMNNPKNIFSPWKKYFISYIGYNKNDSTFFQRIKGVFRMFYSREAKIKMRKLLADFEPEIAHIHNIYHQISPSILTEIKKKNIPIVMTVHDYKLICPDYLLQDWEELGKHKYAKFIFGKKFKNSYLKSFLIVAEFLFHKYLDIYDKNIDCYIVPSLFVKNKLVSGGIDECKISVLPHFFLKSQTENYLSNESEKYVFYFGKISKEKNVDELIAMFKEFKDAKLYLAGEIEADFQMEKNQRIKYLGVLNREEINKHIAGALFVVSGSKLPETFGLIALEAISLEKPFLGYDFGAYSEIIDNGIDGFLCQDESEFKEKARLLIQDENLRKKFGENALKKSQKFRSEKYLKKIKNIFKKILKEKRLTNKQ
ncbi:MAG TPA: hypothetical protein DCS28_03265 [Candidatus Moranbacteria bacterium]|nr:hypothetical protein [Candidatus Moranbacteria bacterium]HAT75031.1 hypothetical protein [Candidatus Moranbacteria bacterium]